MAGAMGKTQAQMMSEIHEMVGGMVAELRMVNARSVANSLAIHGGDGPGMKATLATVAATQETCPARRRNWVQVISTAVAIVALCLAAGAFRQRDRAPLNAVEGSTKVSPRNATSPDVE